MRVCCVPTLKTISLDIRGVRTCLPPCRLEHADPMENSKHQSTGKPTTKGPNEAAIGATGRLRYITPAARRRCTAHRRAPCRHRVLGHGLTRENKGFEQGGLPRTGSGKPGGTGCHLNGQACVNGATVSRPRVCHAERSACPSPHSARPASSTRSAARRGVDIPDTRRDLPASGKCHVDVLSPPLK